MKVDVINIQREKVSELEVSDAIFNCEVNEDLIYEIVKSQLANRRSGSQKAKTRSEVSGSTKKIYKQKGTGRARHGSIRAPIFVGGGRAHAPRPRDWSYRLPQKMRESALKSALTSFYKNGNLLFIDRLQFEQIRTKNALKILNDLSIADSKVVIVDTKENENLKRSVANLTNCSFLPPEGVNVYDLLKHKFLILSVDAAKLLQNRFLA